MVDLLRQCASDAYFFNLMADSSPVFGRDWFIVQYEIICFAGLEGLFEDMCGCESLRHSDPDNETVEQARARSLRAKRLQQIEGARDLHITTPTAVGSRRASIAHKMHNLLHTLLIDCKALLHVLSFCIRVACITTDHGTESLVSKAPRCILSADDFMPHIGCHDVSQPDLQNGVQDSDPNVQSICGEQETCVTKIFPNALWVLGPLHILHGITKDLTSSLADFSSKYLPMLQTIASFLKEPWMLDRFVERCLTVSPEAWQYKHLFASIDIALADWRWFSLMKAVRIVLERMTPLRIYFNVLGLVLRSQYDYSSKGNVGKYG